MSTFTDCLASEKAMENHDLSLFGQFVGEWDFDWVGHGDNEGRVVKGEWIFSYILNGTATQDMFICPSREVRKNHNEPDGEYGTTFRVPKFDDPNTWYVTYGCDKGGPVSRLIARRVGNDIIQTGINDNPEDENTVWQWNFTEITKESFRWECKYSQNKGLTWFSLADIYATRRK